MQPPARPCLCGDAAAEGSVPLPRGAHRLLQRAGAPSGEPSTTSCRRESSSWIPLATLYSASTPRRASSWRSTTATRSTSAASRATPARACPSPALENTVSRLHLASARGSRSGAPSLTSLVSLPLSIAQSPSAPTGAEGEDSQGAVRCHSGGRGAEKGAPRDGPHSCQLHREGAAAGRGGPEARGRPRGDRYAGSCRRLCTGLAGASYVASAAALMLINCIITT